jgi:hypothetical protein
MTPGAGQDMHGYIAALPQHLLPSPQHSHSSSQVQRQHQNQNQNSAPPLAYSVATGGHGGEAVSSAIQHSMSMGDIPGNGNGMLTPNTPWFNVSGCCTPSGVLTPGPQLFRPTVTRLGAAIPSSTFTNNILHEHQTSEYETYLSSAGGAVSPSMPAVLSPMLSSGGSGSGPGTASNGGSVLLTPTTDDTTPFEYHHFAGAATGGCNHAVSRTRRSGSIGYADGADDDEEDDEEDEDNRMATALAHLVGAAGPNGSPRQGVGVTRTPKKRRSITIAAGPSAAAAAAGNARSRSGTKVGGQANSPLVMKELSLAHQPMIEWYLNRYLNHLCTKREFFLFLMFISCLFFFSFFSFATPSAFRTTQPINEYGLFFDFRTILILGIFDSV